MREHAAPLPAFLTGGGETGALMRSLDWSGSALGSPAQWPQSLSAVVGLMLNTSFPMFVAWGPELSFLYNDAYAEVLGAKHPSAMGEPFHEIWTEIWPDIYPIIEQAMAGQSTYHKNLPLQMMRKGFSEPTWFTFSYAPMRDESGQVAGVYCACTETTEQVLAEAHRAKEIERLRQLFYQAPGVIAVLRDSNHVFEIANKAYLELVGERDDIIGKPVREALPDIEGQIFFDLLDRVYTTGEPFVGRGVPVMLKRSSDSAPERRYVNFVYQPTRDHLGRVSGIFVEGSDVTDAVLADQRKDEFLAMLAHELRNPLAPISTAAELLKLTARDEKRVLETSHVIARQVAHMTKLVDDLLDVSRVTRGLVTLQEENLALNSIVADAVEQVHAMIESKRHHFTIEAPARKLWVRGDRTRLIQVFSNLLNNAAKYTPGDGVITLRLQEDQGQAAVSVEDNGIGIDPALLPYIFDLFTQAERSPDRSQGGLGLGLALVKSLVELQGGSVRAQSAGPGKGSLFTVRLPLAAAQEAEPVAPASQAVPGSEGLQLMVVDDNRDAAQTLSLLLEAVGHRVVVSHDATEAIAMARLCRPALLFLDIGLPDVDGYTLARRLRGMPETARAMLVAVTGYGQPDDKARALAAGFDHHLVKPVKLDAVLALVGDAAAKG